MIIPDTKQYLSKYHSASIFSAVLSQLDWVQLFSDKCSAAKKSDFKKIFKLRRPREVQLHAVWGNSTVLNFYQQEELYKFIALQSKNQNPTHFIELFLMRAKAHDCW